MAKKISLDVADLMELLAAVQQPPGADPVQPYGIDPSMANMINQAGAQDVRLEIAKGEQAIEQLKAEKQAATTTAVRQAELDSQLKQLQERQAGLYKLQQLKEFGAPTRVRDIMTAIAPQIDDPIKFTPDAQIEAAKAEIYSLLGQSQGEIIAKGIDTKFADKRKAAARPIIDAAKAAAPPGYWTEQIEQAMERNIDLQLSAPGSDVSKIHAAQVSQVTSEAARAAAEKAAYESGVVRARAAGLSLPEAEVAAKAGGAFVDPALREAPIGEAVNAKRSASLKKWGIMGAAGTAVAALLASKLFGKDESEARNNPMAQMQMLAQLMALKKQMGGGAGQDQDQTGKRLLEMSRAMGIVQMMQRMSGMQQAQPSTMGLI